MNIPSKVVRCYAQICSETKSHLIGGGGGCPGKGTHISRLDLKIYERRICYSAGRLSLNRIGMERVQQGGIADVACAVGS